MKKQIFIFVILSFFQLNIFSNENSDFLNTNAIKFTLSPEFSLKNGTINEFSYIESPNGQLDKLSELNWELKNNINLGAKANIEFNKFDFEFSCLFGIPKESGTLKDSDWKNFDSNYNINPFLKTNYSKSQNKITYDTDITFLVDYNIYSNTYIYCKPFIAFNYSKTQFYAKDGIGWYGDKNSTGLTYDSAWDSSDARYIDSLLPIEYSNTKYTLFLGLKTSFWITSDCFISSDMGISAFVYVDSLDAHFYDSNGNNKNYYNDKMYSFFNDIIFNINLNYNFTKKFSARVDFDLDFLTTIQGESFSGTNKNSLQKDNIIIPKCNIFIYSFNILFSYKF